MSLTLSATHTTRTASTVIDLPFGGFISEEVANIVVNIILSITIILVAFIIGFLLRRMIVQRLSQTVLDSWIAQTLGLFALLLPLIIGAGGALAIWNHLATMVQFLEDRGFNLYDLGIRLLTTILLLTLGTGIARTLRKQIFNALSRGNGENRLDINIRTLIGRIVSVVILAIAIFSSLSVWNIEITIPITAISIISVIISISIQDILKDLMAGFYLLFTRPFYIGDQISVTLGMVTYVGKVLNIELRATRLQRVSYEEVSIPNAQLFTNPVVNYTHFEGRRAIIEIKLPREDFAQQETAFKIIQALNDDETVQLKPEPQVLFHSYAEEKAVLHARFWLASERAIDVSDTMYLLHALLPSAELTIREPAEVTM
jgi:small-conductance mechanosensitive channel